MSRPPSIELTGARGLSTEEIACLKETLDALAMDQARSGDGALHVLAQCAREFLAEHNVPPAPSFYEQRKQLIEQQRTATIEKQRRTLEFQASPISLSFLLIL